MEEFNNPNNNEEIIETNSEVTDAEEVYETEIDAITEEPEIEIITEKPEIAKKRKTNSVIAVLSAALIICLTVTTFLAFKLYSPGNKGNGSIIHSSEFNQEDKINNSGEQFVPDGKQLTTAEVAVKVGPSVVGIVNKGVATNMFFQQETTSVGSGVIVSEDGYIVTNFHVIENNRALNVILNTGEELPATVAGYDERSDLAVIKIEKRGLTYATFGDSSQVMVGEKAIAIGNPLGTELMGTVTEGIISAVNRTVTVENKTLTLLQTDAAINNGNSGGALVNSYGEIIGINSVKMAAAGVEGIGFAIPSNTVKTVIDDVIEFGYVRGRLVIGVYGTNITEKLSGYYGLPVGFYVSEVTEGYGAYLSGIRPGDVIVKCDGQKIETIDDINAIRDKHKVGDTMAITVSRGNEELTYDVKLMEERPAEQ